jgi:hypothetical protein
VRTRIFEDYANIDAIREADFLVTYTCDVVPPVEVQEALHGTNPVPRLLDNGLYGRPRWAPLMMETLGTQYFADPPIAAYKSTVADPDHPPTQGGMEPFETTDELFIFSEISARVFVIIPLILDRFGQAHEGDQSLRDRSSEKTCRPHNLDR